MKGQLRVAPHQQHIATAVALAQQHDGRSRMGRRRLGIFHLPI
jgi:hypothetical protein